MFLWFCFFWFPLSYLYIRDIFQVSLCWAFLYWLQLLPYSILSLYQYIFFPLKLLRISIFTKTAYGFLRLCLSREKNIWHAVYDEFYPRLHDKPSRYSVLCNSIRSKLSGNNLFCFCIKKQYYMAVQLYTVLLSSCH